jgi:hypothetical protein
MAKRSQQTMAKMQREKMVRDRREAKQEKKRVAKAERQARADGTLPPLEDETSAFEDVADDDVTEPAAASLD